MVVSVVRSESSHRLAGEGPVVDAANRFLGHLEARRYSPATVRAYAFDLLNFDRFLEERDLELDDVRPTDSSTTWTGSRMSIAVGHRRSCSSPDRGWRRRP
jgi:integrase/recombinase XerC